MTVLAVITSKNHGSADNNQRNMVNLSAISSGYRPMKAYPSTDALIKSGAFVRSPVSIARKSPPEAFERCSYPSASLVLRAMGARMAALALRLGMNGPMTVAAAMRPSACQAKLPGNSRSMNMASLFISPQRLNARLSANELNSSQNVDWENAENTVSMGTPQTSTYMEHMSRAVMKSGRTRPTHQTIPQISIPSPAQASRLSPVMGRRAVIKPNRMPEIASTRFLCTYVPLA